MDTTGLNRRVHEMVDKKDIPKGSVFLFHDNPECLMSEKNIEKMVKKMREMGDILHNKGDQTD